MGVSGMNKVTKIDVFDDFHELASILLQARTTFCLLMMAQKYYLAICYALRCLKDKSISSTKPFITSSADKMSSQYELDTTFDVMCHQDKTYCEYLPTKQ